MALIELLLAIKLIVADIKNQAIFALQTIVGNWGLTVAECIKLDVKSNICLRQIALVSSMYKSNYEDAQYELNFCIIQCILSKKTRQSSRHYASLIEWTLVLNTSNRHGPSNVIMFSILKAAKIWIGSDKILKAGFPDGREGTVEGEEKEKHGEEEDCLSYNKTSKLTIVKKRKNKYSKSSTKNNPAERLTTIMIFSPKKKLRWSAYCHCTNVDDIPKTWREKLKCKELINL